MTLNEILENSNLLNEDEMDEEQFIAYFDRTIAWANLNGGFELPSSKAMENVHGDDYLDVEYPSIVPEDSETDEAFILKDNYVQLCILPYLSRLVALNDTDMTTADLYKMEADSGLALLRQNKERDLPEQWIEVENRIGELTNDEFNNFGVY